MIRRVLKHAYCNQIERLMILGNFMLLCEIDPGAVYRWFMELFIDAYDWVMVPNVYGMRGVGCIVLAIHPSTSEFFRGQSAVVGDGLGLRSIEGEATNSFSDGRRFPQAVARRHLR